MYLRPIRIAMCGVVVFVALGFSTISEAQNRRPPASGNRASTHAIKPDDPFFYRKVGLSPEGVKLADEAMETIQKVKARAIELSKDASSASGKRDWIALAQQYSSRRASGPILAGFASRNVHDGKFEVPLKADTYSSTLEYVALLELLSNGAIHQTNLFPSNLRTLPFSYSRQNHRLRAGAQTIIFSAFLPKVPAISSPTLRYAIMLEAVHGDMAPEELFNGFLIASSGRLEANLMSLAMDARNGGQPLIQLDFVSTEESDFHDFRNGDSSTFYSIKFDVIRFGERHRWGIELESAIYRRMQWLNDNKSNSFLKGLRTDDVTLDQAHYRNRLLSAAFAPFIE